MQAEQELSAWRHWREECALARIPEPERRQLQQGIADRFRSRVRRMQTAGLENLRPPSNVDCGQLFESYCALHQRRDGKKYKHWLLERGRQDLDTVQSGVMLLIRNVVREWIRDCYPKSGSVSLHQLLGSGGRSVTLEELLPDTSEAPLSREELHWMEERAASGLSDVSDVEQAALRIRGRGEVFSRPGVAKKEGFGKTALHHHYRELMIRQAEQVKQRFPGLSPEQGSFLVLELLDRWAQMLLSEKSAEMKASAAFEGKENMNDTE